MSEDVKAIGDLLQDPAALARAVKDLKPFVPKGEFSMMLHFARNGSDKIAYQEKLLELAHRVATMPVTYAQDGKGDEAIVYLHYFHGGSDWYITEALEPSPQQSLHLIGHL